MASRLSSARVAIDRLAGPAAPVRARSGPSRLRPSPRALLPAITFASAIALSPGCYLDHGRGDSLAAPLDAATVHPRDAGSVVTVDAPPSLVPDAPLVLDAAMCALSDRAVEVRVEPVTMDVARCAVTHVDAMRVYALEPAPEDDGIRVRADFCPAVDADCRCDIVISNVGTDVAPSELLATSLSLDVRAGSGPGTFVSIAEMPRCRCDGCACSLAIVLYAADTTPEMAPFVPREVSFAQGGEVCPNEGCVSGTWNVAVAFPSASFDVPAGTTRVDGAIHARSVRDVDIFAPCAACAGCGVAHGSWVAWAAD